MQDWKISTEYDGSTRKLFRCECKQCTKEFWRPKHILHKATCCSRKCYQLFREKTGKRVDVICSFCGANFKRWQHHLAKVSSRRHFCSRLCQGKAFIKDKGNCISCNIKLTGSGKKYCTINCQNDFKFKNNIIKWKNGELSGMHAGEALNVWVKKYLVDKAENKCSECGWCKINPTTGKIPLQVDHIDGNYKNNKEDNLRVLCPSCHSLTPTYGGLNMGRGREKRRLKLQGNKNAA